MELAKYDTSMHGGSSKLMDQVKCVEEEAENDLFCFHEISIHRK